MTHIKNLLLVDDSDATNNFHSRILGKLNFAENIFISTNGKEGIERIQSAEFLPDLIFLDLNMPIMDGFEFLAEIHEHLNEKEDEKPLIVILSSSEEKVDMERCKTLYEPILFYSKPLGLPQIQAIAESVRKV